MRRQNFSFILVILTLLLAKSSSKKLLMPTHDLLKLKDWSETVKNLTWIPNCHSPPMQKMEDFRSRLGLHPDFQKHSPQEKPSLTGVSETYIPDSFDSRSKWPKCSRLISSIQNQGACGACWAIASTSTMTDRLCIHSENNTFQDRVSAENLLSCCQECSTNGCIGGISGWAWYYWYSEGIVTGGSYGSKEGCQPYPHPPCEFMDSCKPEFPIQAPTCSKKCLNPDKDIDYQASKTYGHWPYSIAKNEEEIRLEILTNGPVEAGMQVYADFTLYHDGVYRHVLGDFVGYHAVKIIGWGHENGLPYWLAANSWDTRWGQDGFFKIVRGENHCGIESHVNAAMPKFNHDAWSVKLTIFCTMSGLGVFIVLCIFLQVYCEKRKMVHSRLESVE